MIRRWEYLTLLQRFTILSAVITAFLAVVFSGIIVWVIGTVATREQARNASEVVLRTITPQLEKVDLAGPLPADRRKFLDAVLKAHGVSDQVGRIRLWRADGRLLYSNAPEPKALETAAVDLTTQAGQMAYVERQGRAEPNGSVLLRLVRSLFPAQVAMRSFIPVRFEGDSKPIAAFEVFYDLTRFRQQLRYIDLIVWIAVPIGFSVLYVSVASLVRKDSRRLQQQQADLIAAHLGTIQSLAAAIDVKDSYTFEHSKTVADLAALVARALKLSAEEVDDVRVVASLHDIGKLGVPDAILMKPGPLEPDELLIMRTHAERSFEILMKAHLSDRVKLAVRCVHERWDGKGYPDGLGGQTIPVISRIVAVVDAYEAMTSDRAYRRALPQKEALERLKRGAGSQFDPRIVGAFVQQIRKRQLGTSRRAPAVSRS